MVKQSKNKNTADIFSAIWRFSRSMQMYRIGVYNTTPRLISHNISNPSKFYLQFKFLQIGKLFILKVGFEICWNS